MLRRIENGDNLNQVIVARVNAAIDKINELADLHGDGMTIAIDPAMNWEVRCLLEPAASGGSGGSGGEVALGVLVSGPSNGYGAAVWRAITVNPDGTWTAAGEEVPVIVPLLK